MPGPGDLVIIALISNDMFQDGVSKRLGVFRRLLNPLSEKSMSVLAVGATGSSSSRTVDTSSLACQRATGTQPLVQQFDVFWTLHSTYQYA